MTTTDRQKKISYWPTALTIADSDCSGGAGTGHDSEMCRVAARKQVMDDVLLSPIFDSISKRGMPRLSAPRNWKRRQAKASSTIRWWLLEELPSTNCPCWNHGISGVLPCWAASGSNRSPFNVALELSVMRTLTVSPIWASPLSNTTILFCPVRPQSCSRLRLL